MNKKDIRPIFNVCEFLGSMFLVIAAVAPLILFVEIFDADIAIAVLADAIAIGFVLFALIEIFGPICTSFFNPVVTMALAINKEISYQKAIGFIISQILGGIVGVLSVHLMFFNEIPKIIFVSSIVRNGGNYFAEIIGTFILVLTIFSLVHQKSDRVSLIVGLLVGGMVLSTSSMMFANPQITIARIFTYSAAGIRPFDAIIFIIMQIIGAYLALIFWKKIKIACDNIKINY
jgi:glycerol uptake facilitator-like aquaporin